ncbi:unnamed protein product, partial [marine sediment metagenome]
QVELNVAFIDIVFAILILAASIRGAFRGFVAEIGSMAALILGLGGAILFSKSLSQVLAGYFGESVWNQLISFLLIFLVIYVLVKLLESLLHHLFERLNLERLDRVLGFFLGITEGFILIGVVLFVLNWQTFFETNALLADSLFAKILFPFLPSPDRIFSYKTFLKNV